MMVLPMVVGMLVLGMGVGIASAEPYRIMTNSPVYVAGSGNEVVLVYGEAPDAQWVDIVLANQTHTVQVRDGSFHLTIPAPPPGTYALTGIWQSETLEAGPGGYVEKVITGHLNSGLLTVLGRGFDDAPGGSATISPGAHREGCVDCVDYTAGVVEAGGYVLVSNADSENHQFVTRSAWAVESTGNLDPGESVRIPFNAEGTAAYACIYHPWLEFSVQSSGMYKPADAGGSIILEVPDHAGDSVRVGITHTGGAAVAHVVFIQGGTVLEAGTAPLTDGYGVFTVDAVGWRVGEVIVSVSAGPDHTTETVSVRPPPGAAERSGRITGYDGPDGILINGGVARPAGIIPLDAASEATRQVCQVGQQAVFRGDIGLAPRGTQYVLGTVWCDGVNLGIYLLESGLAITDTAECEMARADWLTPYCFPQLAEDDVPMVAGTNGTGGDTISDGTGMDNQDTVDGMNDMDGTGGQDMMNGTASEDSQGVKPEEPAEEMFVLIPDDIPAVPGNVGEPDYQKEDVCDHFTDPTCPCPEGWVRNGDWCDPDVYAGLDSAADAVDDAAGDAGDMMGGVMDEAGKAFSGPAEDVKGGMIDTLSGFFGWIAEGLASIPTMFLDLGKWLVDRLVFAG